jgi:DNA repair protein REV1
LFFTTTWIASLRPLVFAIFQNIETNPAAISHHGQRPTDPGPIDIQPQCGNSTSECATCNYEALKFGIKNGMHFGWAKGLCPELVVLHYDFGGYEEVSDQLADILATNKLDGAVEQISCDEAYLVQFLDHSNGHLATDFAETKRLTAPLVGVVSNKSLSKLATDRGKPNRFFVVDDHRELLKDLSNRMESAGGRTKSSETRGSLQFGMSGDSAKRPKWSSREFSDG